MSKLTAWLLPAAPRSLLERVVLPACLFLLVLGAKWTAVRQFGSSIPEWDQWDAAALHVFVPWFESHLTLADLLLPHNEHRVVLTKLLELTLLLLNGQWDVQLECGVNAVLHSALAAGLFVVSRQYFHGRWQVLPFLLLGGIFGLPLAWQNVLGGFHSQQYFLLGLSVAAIALLPFARQGSPKWWTGLACACLALLSMASGFFAATVIGAMVVLRVWRGAVPMRAAGITFAACVALSALGWFTHVEVDYHAGLKAHSVGQFFESVLLSLKWPAQGPLPLAALIWAPWVCCTWRGLRRTGGPDRAEGTLLALGLWVLLQVAATAYTRAGGDTAPASRYLDTLGLGVAVNGLAFGILIPPFARRHLSVAVAAVLVWAGVTTAGITAVARHNLESDLPVTHAYLVRAEQHVRSYLATNDARHLAQGDIPYPSKDALIERLAHQSLRNIMPPVVRPPLAVAAGAIAGPFASISPDGHAVEGGPSALGRTFWSSYGAADANPETWVSAAFHTSAAGYLQFRIAGTVQGENLGLEIRSAYNDEPVAFVTGDTSSGAAWRTAYVYLPAGYYRMAAYDRDPGHWLAFTQPVEVGRLSYWAPRILRQGPLLMAVAAGLAAVALLAGWIWTCDPASSPPESRPAA